MIEAMTRAIPPFRRDRDAPTTAATGPFPILALSARGVGASLGASEATTRRVEAPRRGIAVLVPAIEPTTSAVMPSAGGPDELSHGAEARLTLY